MSGNRDIATYFGLDDARAALIFPRRHLDMRQPVTDADELVERIGRSGKQDVIVTGVVEHERYLDDVSARPRRVKGRIRLDNGDLVGFSQFYGRDDRDVFTKKIQPGERVVMQAQAVLLDDKMPWLTFKTRLPAGWIGHMMPVYPASSGFTHWEVMAYIAERIKRHGALETSAKWLIERMSHEVDETLDVESLARLLRGIHVPESPQAFDKAFSELKDILARDALVRLSNPDASSFAPGLKWDFEIAPESAKALKSRYGFDLTPSQKKAVAGIAERINQGGMNALLIGDVGSGKTEVYASVCAATLKAGQRACIVVPNEILAHEIHQRFIEAFPELSDSTLLVTGKTDRKMRLTDYDMLIGTQAILRRKSGQFGLVVLDEEHRFGEKQKRDIANNAANVLVVSATPIPKTLTGALSGGREVFRIVREGRAERHVNTKIFGADSKRAALSAILSHLDRGEQCAIIYPLKSKGRNSSTKSIEEVIDYWERRLPGRVGVLHGDMTNEHKQEVMEKMRSGEYQLLLSTTVIEVGVTLKDLMAVMTVGGQHLGLVQHHQLKGRPGRAGKGAEIRLADGTTRVSDGHCHYYVVETSGNEQSLARLKVLEKTCDGEQIALEDARIRGPGALMQGVRGELAEKQSGLVKTPIPSISLGLDDLLSVMNGRRKDSEPSSAMSSSAMPHPH